MSNGSAYLVEPNVNEMTSMGWKESFFMQAGKLDQLLLHDFINAHISILVHDKLVDKWVIK